MKEEVQEQLCPVKDQICVKELRKNSWFVRRVSYQFPETLQN